MAFAPAFVVHSRFMTVDVPTTFFVALAFHQAVALHASPRPMRTLLWGAFWAGCAAGSKYNAGLALLAPLVGLWLLPNLPVAKRLLGSGGSGGRCGADLPHRVPWRVGRLGAVLGKLLVRGAPCRSGARRSFHEHRTGLAVSPEAEPQRGFRRGGANHQRGRLGVARAEPCAVGRARGVAGVLPADWRSGSALFALHLPAAANAGDGRGVAVVRRAIEFTPLLQVPPASRGEPSRRGFPEYAKGNEQARAWFPLLAGGT
jgi:hypothetical protein